MPLVIEAIVPARFPTWVRQRRFQVVFLGQGVTVRRPTSAVRNLELMFPGEIGAGWMARETVPDADWWQRHWVTELGPYRPSPPPPGVWLFHHGWVAGHHPGTAHAGDVDTWDKVREYLLDRMRLKAAATDDGTSWTRTGTAGTADEGPRRQARVQVYESEPYEVLEVAPDAADDVVKSAYRTALKLNHPDRVAHLSKQIQAFAHERTQLIVAAWQAIKEARGIR